ncbi:unnamed protein product [Lactuca virosa]|uniref:GATA transcription factor n=1 Tax=Lactuca virosa TaxID=75947 RepID=A0AAU9MB27_9ASTR|nr:unnamed protein product [Lactuca virosa]
MNMENTEFVDESSLNHPQQFSPEKLKTENFLIDDLLNFPADEMVPAVAENIVSGASTDSSTIVDTCNSPLCGGAEHNSPGDIPRRSFTDAPFTSDLCVPYDDLAELEWLSNVVEESFSCEDLQKLQLISGIKTRPNYTSNNQQFQPETVSKANNPIFNTDMAVPGKARTKRSRAAPCNWTSRLLAVSPTASGTTVTMSSESESDIASSSIRKKIMKAGIKRKEVYDNPSHNGDGRKCLHCATDKTPQWRTGPLGPKTLCNACGVRFKSGRLVPEYRPAASPTFVTAKHSNSHRKVMELRRQNEMHQHQYMHQNQHQHQSQHQHQHQHHQQQQQQQFFHQSNMIFDVPNNDDYLIHQHIGPDYRQLI